MKTTAKLTLVAASLAAVALTTPARADDHHHTYTAHRYAHHYGSYSRHSYGGGYVYHRSTTVEPLTYSSPYYGYGPGIYDVRPAYDVTFGFGGHRYNHWAKY